MRAFDSPRSRRTSTLIELLVVVFIIGLLIALLLNPPIFAALATRAGGEVFGGDQY